MSTRRCGNSTSLGYYSYGRSSFLQLINDPAPQPSQQLGVNLIGCVGDGIYLWTAKRSKSISDGVALPSPVARRDSAADLRGFPGALATLTTAVVGPITDAINNATTGIRASLVPVITNAIAVLGACAATHADGYDSLAGGVRMIANKALAIINGFVTSVASLIVEVRNAGRRRHLDGSGGACPAFSADGWAPASDRNRRSAE